MKKIRTAAAVALAAAFLLVSAHYFAAPVLKAPGKAKSKPPTSKKFIIPAKYEPIIKRGIFGFMPRKEALAKLTAGQFVTGGPMLPSTLFPLRATSTHDIFVTLPTPPEKSAPAFILTGIIDVNGRLKAIIEDKAAGLGFYTAEGGKAGGYTVTKISKSGVTLENNGDTIELNLQHVKEQNQTDTMDAPGAPDKPPPPPNENYYPMHIRPRIGR